MAKHTFAMSSVTGDTRILARSAFGYDWNYLADTETLIFGTGSDATLQWTGSALASSVGLTFTTGTITLADGGAVTQLTSKATTVTLPNLTGAITLYAAALADDAIVSFTVTDTAVAATDSIIVNHKSGGTLGSYNVQAHTVAAGSFKIAVQNVSGGSLSEALVLSFAVIKGAIT
tara:strand:+ start:84 stop:608 length:525 start_codon:yes stop_codon:yes gene_type:complete